MTTTNEDIDILYDKTADFIKSYITLKNGDLTVIKDLLNNNPLPQVPGCVLHLINEDRLALPVTSYQGNIKTTTTLTKAIMQMDFYGNETSPSHKIAKKIYDLYNNDEAYVWYNENCPNFSPAAPLSIQNKVFISEEKQYYHIYTIDIMFTYELEVKTPVQTFCSVTITLEKANK